MWQWQCYAPLKLWTDLLINSLKPHDSESNWHIAELCSWCRNPCEVLLNSRRNAHISINTMTSGHFWLPTPGAMTAGLGQAVRSGLERSMLLSPMALDQLSSAQWLHLVLQQNWPLLHAVRCICPLTISHLLCIKRLPSLFISSPRVLLKSVYLCPLILPGDFPFSLCHLSGGNFGQTGSPAQTASVAFLCPTNAGPRWG